MKKLLAFCSLILCFSVFATGQETFSIVAVDPLTGEVGSAGASCIDSLDCMQSGIICEGAELISGLLPGRGAINAQATVCIPNTNLNIGLNQLSAGLSPEEVLNYLLNNDGCIFGSTATRQYGIVDFDPDGNPRAQGYTGSDCLDYKNHNTGSYYSIQGNILLGQEILDSMEQRFLNTEGPLAKRLMAALQGANVPGADSRCLDLGISSKSSFIRVARPDDTNGNFYLDLIVASVATGVDPIDSLQTRFDAWMMTTVNQEEIPDNPQFLVYPNPVSEVLTVEHRHPEARYLTIYNTNGQVLEQRRLTGNSTSLPVQRFASNNLILLEIRDGDQQLLFTEKIIVE